MGHYNMANFVCPTNGKDYILPTKAWLEPLEVLVSQDYSTRGKLIISELVKAHKVLVKLTSGDKINTVLDKYEKTILNANKQIVLAYTKDWDFKKFIAQILKINFISIIYEQKKPCHSTI